MKFTDSPIDVQEGGPVCLAGVSWTANVQSDESLSLTMVVAFDDRLQVSESLREGIKREVKARTVDVRAIAEQVGKYVSQIEAVPFSFVLSHCEELFV
jgi:hypothetical protein